VASLTPSGGVAHAERWRRSRPAVASLTPSGGVAHAERWRRSCRAVASLTSNCFLEFCHCRWEQALLPWTDIRRRSWHHWTR